MRPEEFNGICSSRICFECAPVFVRSQLILYLWRLDGVGNLRQVLRRLARADSLRRNGAARKSFWISAPGNVKSSNAEVRSDGPICVPKPPNCTAEIVRGLLQTEQF